MMSVARNSYPLAAVDTDDFNFKDGKMKVLCVSAWYENKWRLWFKIDPRSSESASSESQIQIQIPPSDQLSNTIRVPTVAVVDSKDIYVISGMNRATTRKNCNEVHVYNIKTATWRGAPPVNHPRSCPLVFVIGRKIYLFGCRFCPRQFLLIPLQGWVECYDLDSPGSGWNTFPAPIQDEDKFLSGPIYAGVFYQHKNQILFWGPSTAGIFAFDLSSNTWSFTKADQLCDDQTPKPCFNFMSNHVVFGHLVLWQYRGILYSWDLTNHTTKEICILNRVCFPEPDPRDYTGDCPGPSRLLHLGNGLLCLFRWRMFAQKETIISCYKFQIESGTAGELHVHPAGFQSFSVPGFGIEHFVVLSADCMGCTTTEVKNGKLSSS